MDREAKITFGIIVLNGEPFVQPNLQALYPFAHEIIVVEGASPNARSAANPHGHSKDGTLETLREFAKHNDPEDKIQIVTAEDDGHPNGFWPEEKTQQSQAYARRATGDWIWQIDIDEFYHPEDMVRLIRYVAENPETTCVRFGAYHFWGGFDHVVEGGFMWHPSYQGEPFGRYRRLFKWKRGWHYATHRPPTILDDQGVDVTRRRLADASEILGKPKVMYHYFMVDAATILRKAEYYQKLRPDIFTDRLAVCAEILKNLTVGRGLRLFDQFGTWNWLQCFNRNHPPVIAALIRGGAGSLLATLPSIQLNALTSGFRYRMAVAFLRVHEGMLSVLRAGRFTFINWLVARIQRMDKAWERILPTRWRRFRGKYWFLTPSEEALLPPRLRQMANREAYDS